MQQRGLIPLLGLCLGVVPWAPARAQPAHAQPLLAQYEVRAAGMAVMRVEAMLDLDGPRYLIRTRSRTTGLVGALSSGDQVTAAEGRWQGAEPVPAHYRVDGMWRGTRRLVVMDWTTPGIPRISAIEPPNEAEREAVPDALQRGTMDALSALAKLTRAVAETGRCDLQAAVFDGRRRADYTVRTLGFAPLPTGGAWSGEALRCGFEGRVIAGFRGDQDPEEARRPQPATAWMARVAPGRPPLPVLIEMPSRWFGTIRAALVGLEAAPGRALPADIAEAPQQPRQGGR
jgi:hypothetical protein